MCDYCGCRRSGPTAELADEHVRLQELSDRLRQVRETGAEAGPVFDEFELCPTLFTHSTPTSGRTSSSTVPSRLRVGVRCCVRSRCRPSTDAGA